MNPTPRSLGERSTREDIQMGTTMTAGTKPTRVAVETRNIAIARRALELVASERTPEVLAEVRELYAPGFRAYGPARARAFHEADAFEDVQLRIERMEASGSRVISRITLRGRHTGVFEGQEPSGRTMEARGVVVHRIEANRIVEAWAVLNWR
jgi:predicted ester cyclase